MLQLVHLMLNLLEVSERGESRFMDRRACLKVHVLRQQTQSQAPGLYDISSIGRLLPADHAEDSRFACAVPADQADVLAGVYLQRRATQDVLIGVGFENFREPKQHVATIMSKQ
jgi:hypothetical protein